MAALAQNPNKLTLIEGGRAMEDKGQAQTPDNGKLFFDFQRALLKGLTHTEFAIYTAISLRINKAREDDWCFPSYETLMDDTGISGRATVSRCVKHIIDLGVVKAKTEKGKVTYYQPSPPSPELIDALLSNCGKNKTRSKNELVSKPVQKMNCTSSKNELLPVQKMNSNESKLMNQINDRGKGKITPSTAGAVAPPPPLKKKPKPPNPEMMHPAIKAYRDTMRKTPGDPARDLIIQHVKDFELWQKILNEWVVNGWNVLNVSGMVNRYLKNSGAARPTSTVVPPKPTRWDNMEDLSAVKARQQAAYQKAMAED